MGVSCYQMMGGSAVVLFSLGFWLLLFPRDGRLDFRGPGVVCGVGLGVD
jgi:hypothetical protein